MLRRHFEVAETWRSTYGAIRQKDVSSIRGVSVSLFNKLGNIFSELEDAL